MVTAPVRKRRNQDPRRISHGGLCGISERVLKRNNKPKSALIKDANDKALAKLSNEMKKHKHLILAVLLCASQMGTAQIFLDDEDMLKRSGAQNTEELIIPLHGVEYDQTDYVPIGGGTLLLAGLGVAYLMKKKHEQNH